MGGNSFEEFDRKKIEMEEEREVEDGIRIKVKA